MAKEGDVAPDFTLEGTVHGEIGSFTLSETVADRPAVLSFYIYDYSPVCTEQMCEINEMEFLTFTDEAAVFGILTDGPYSHREFAKDNDLSYLLLTDEDRTVYEQYGMTETEENGKQKLKRGIIVVDSDRTVRYRWVAKDNWDAWEIKPFNEANNFVREVVNDQNAV